jgi:putative transposase
MPDYPRNRVPDGTFFLTVDPPDRRSGPLVTRIDALLNAVRQARHRALHHIDAQCSDAITRFTSKEP